MDQMRLEKLQLYKYAYFTRYKYVVIEYTVSETHCVRNIQQKTNQFKITPVAANQVFLRVLECFAQNILIDTVCSNEDLN